MKFYIGKKKLQYYKNLLIKADLDLHDQIARQVQKRVPSGARILDLGAGEGALSARLADLGYLVTAADKDKQSFKCMNADFSCIDFDSVSEIEAFVTRHENTFDAVLGVEVIEHVHDQWQYVHQLLKMTKPNGLILITTPNTASWLSRLHFLFSGRFHQFSDADVLYGHINPISLWELSLVMRGSGVEEIEILPAGTLPPVYLDGFNKQLLLNIFALILRPFLRGMLDGWCVMAIGRKSA